MKIEKRDGKLQNFDINKILNAIYKAFDATQEEYDIDLINKTINEVYYAHEVKSNVLNVEEIQNTIEQLLMSLGYYKTAKAFILYRDKRFKFRNLVRKANYISEFTDSENSATGSEVDANANVANKNVAVLYNELYKSDNKELNNYRVCKKLKELYGDNIAERYLEDQEHHIIYKNDASSAGLFPYCVAINLYPFITKGLKDVGGLSAAPENLQSFIGMNINLIFAIASQFSGAVAQGDFFVFFEYFCRKEWGEDWYLRLDEVIENNNKKRTIRKILENYMQQWVYSLNQPAGARGSQSCFTNISYYDINYFNSLFGEFVFPDNTKPVWDSLNSLQKLFMKWFNKERLRCVLTFPVETVAMLSDGKGDILDKEWFDFSTKMYEEGHSFFTYISDSADSLASCCFDENQKVVIKTGQDVLCLTFKDLDYKIKKQQINSFKIFSNSGKWEDGELVKTTSNYNFLITLEDKTELCVTGDHVFPTINGDKSVIELNTGESLLYNTTPLNPLYTDYTLGYDEGVILGLYYLFGNIISNNLENKILLELNIPSTINNESIIKSINKVVLKHGTSVIITNNVDPVLGIDSIILPIDSFYNILSYYTKSFYSNNKIISNNVILAPIQFRVGILSAFELIQNKDNVISITGTDLDETIQIISASLGLTSSILNDKRTVGKFVSNYKRSEMTVPDRKQSSEIISIEPILDTKNVYCFKMDNDQDPYFILPNGIITHNCRLRNKLMDNTFNFTNGLQGISTGSKSVITLNMNRITQDWSSLSFNDSLENYLINILERVYKYHTAYNELLWDLFNSKMLSVYSAGFISLNQQYLTIGVNGLNEAAMFLGMECTNNEEYITFCDNVLRTIKEENKKHKSKKCIFNTELVPKRSGHFKPLLIDLKLLVIGQQGASKIYIRAA